MPKLNDENRPEGMNDEGWNLMKILASDEPLHDDLVPYFENKEGITSLRHPLVYQVFGVNNGLANKQYEQKTKAVAKAIREGKWYTYVFLHERPYRCDALIAVRDDVGVRISDEDWWKLVGAVWTDSENIWQNFAEWDDILNTERPERECMMNADERVVFDSLPNEITVYRGSTRGLNEGGLSWTTDHAVARFFARRYDHKGSGVIDHGVVPKALVVAYFDGRNENEIVVEHGEAVTITEREEM
jgi:hypothetical protein